jgi:6,7-dimethyl-8-ribityllumazine synthase
VATREGKLTAQSLRFALIVSRFNSFVTEKLLAGAEDTIRRTGGLLDDSDTIWVPGAYELPLAAQAAARTGKYDAIIALGAVIRGATPHFDYVSGEVSKGLTHVSLSADIPVGFGVLTTNNIEQAIERAGLKAGNKGSEAALAAIEMANLLQEIRG